MKKTVLLFCISVVIARALIGQGVFRVSPGTNFFVNPNVRIVFNNTGFENNGNLGTGNFSRFVFTGNNAIAAISGTGNTLLNELEINKPAGILQLNRFVNVSRSVIFTSGNIDLNGNALIVIADPGGQLVGENSSSRIIGNSGFLRKLATLSSPVNVNPGNIGLTITSAADLGSTFIERYHYGIGTQNVRRIFRIIPTTNSALNATIQFQYLDAEVGGLDENLFTIWKSTNGTTGWVNQGGVVNTSLNTVTLNGINDFAWYTIAPSNASLPVRLSEFNAGCNTDGVLLKWRTTQEENTSHFEIQGSISGIIWSVIATVQASGNSTIPLTYSYTDISSARKFYRLRIVDKDGKDSYSAVRSLDCNNKQWKISVYPNPVKDNIELVLNGINRHSIQVELLNASGQLIWQQQVALSNQYRQLRIPVMHMARGVYYIKVNDPEYRQTLSIIKQ